MDVVGGVSKDGMEGMLRSEIDKNLSWFENFEEAPVDWCGCGEEGVGVDDVKLPFCFYRFPLHLCSRTSVICTLHLHHYPAAVPTPRDCSSYASNQGKQQDG